MIANGIIILVAIVAVVIIAYSIYSMISLRASVFFQSNDYIELRTWVAIERSYPAHTVVVITKEPQVPEAELLDCVIQRLQEGVKYVYLHGENADVESFKSALDERCSKVVGPEKFAKLVEIQPVLNFDEETWDDTPTMIVFLWGDGDDPLSRADMFSGRDPLASIPRAFGYPSTKTKSRGVAVLESNASYGKFSDKLTSAASA